MIKGCLGCLGLIIFIFLFSVILSAWILGGSSSSDNDEDEYVPMNEYSTDTEHKVEDDVDVFTTTLTVGFSRDSFVRQFSMKGVDILRKYHEELDNGAVFRLALPLTDTYGNKSYRIEAVAYFSPETIDKINFDNWPRLESTGLYETADSVGVHHGLGEYQYLYEKNYRLIEGVPLVVYTKGATYRPPEDSDSSLDKDDPEEDAEVTQETQEETETEE